LVIFAVMWVVCGQQQCRHEFTVGLRFALKSTEALRESTNYCLPAHEIKTYYFRVSECLAVICIKQHYSFIMCQHWAIYKIVYLSYTVIWVLHVC